MKNSPLPPPLLLTIQGYGSEGEGVARLPDGMACFVTGALKGERCLVQLDKVGRTCAWGHVVRAEDPSPARLVPDCPWYGACGGCSLRHMTYAEELEFKRQKVQDCLTRLGGCQVPVSVIYGSENTQRYRNKVQFPISGSSIGFYAPRTHAVTDVEDCLLQPTSCARLRLALKGYMAAYGVSAYDEKTGTGLLRHLYVRTNQAGESLCCLLVNGKSLPHEPELVEALRAAEPGLRGVVLGVNEKRNNVILGESYRTLWGQDYLTDTLRGLEFKLSVPSFYQVNAPQAQVLYDLALDLAALTGTETAVDLYCGIGTITLCLAQRAGRVIGAEIVPQAIEDARENARRNGLSNVEFFCGDASAVAARLAAEGTRPDVITVDPPRKGLAEEVVASIAQMAPRRLVYVSCDPATLARDVKRFAGHGYAVQTAAAVDLFPRTPHVETVVCLSRKSDTDGSGKKQGFLENARLLSNTLEITPLLYGSLGLEYLTGQDLNADDIDILIPRVFLAERWAELRSVLEKNGYALVDEHEHTFEKGGIHYAYAQIEELEIFAGIRVSEIETLTAGNVSFKLLSLQQYWKVYTASARDGYRAKVREKKDLDKIAFIEKQLQEEK